MTDIHSLIEIRSKLGSRRVRCNKYGMCFLGRMSNHLKMSPRSVLLSYSDQTDNFKEMLLRSLPKKKTLFPPLVLHLLLFTEKNIFSSSE